MCNNCRLQWCTEHCQEYQKMFPDCRCAKWNQGRDSYTGGDHANKNKFGDVGDYSSNVDNIICPVLASGVKSGRMKLDAAKMVPKSELQRFMLQLGATPIATLVATDNTGNMDPLDIFHMNNHKALEHGLSSGIRDPLPKNRIYLDELLNFANGNGEFTASELMAAGQQFSTPDHQEKLVGDHKVAANADAVSSVFANFMLPILGRCAPHINHYPSQNCSGKQNFMRSDDLEGLFWDNSFPNDFVFFPAGSAAV